MRAEIAKCVLKTTLWNLSTIKTEQNEVHLPTFNDGEHLSDVIKSPDVMVRVSFWFPC